MDQAAHITTPTAQVDKARLFWQLNLGGWGAFATVQLILGLSFLGFSENLFNRLSLFTIGVSLSFGLRVIYQRSAVRNRAGWQVAVIIVGSSLVAASVAGLLFSLSEMANTQLTGAMAEKLDFLYWLNGIFTWMLFFLCWSVMYVGINYRMEAVWERERAVRAEALAQQAQLQALRAQLEPHFLFNTLNAISTLVLENDNPAALRMITTLGEFLRMTLDKADRHEISLAEELEFAHRYAEIQQTRFGDRMRIGFDVDPALLEVRVPALILQPLVENAVKHGVLSQERLGSVAVNIVKLNGRLRITVQDDGPGFSGDDPSSYGVGLGNTVARLDALYGDAAQFSVESAGSHGALVAIELPLRFTGRDPSGPA